MFYNQQSGTNRQNYMELLKRVGALSNLFSESPVPYLYYRAAENVFCKAFEAENLSRGDVSVDASKDRLGIGLKTFLHKNGMTFQKVAEFNKGMKEYYSENPQDIIEVISRQRNERINFAKRAHDLNDVIYHLVTRDVGVFKVFEEEMDYINLDQIRKVKQSKNIIHFVDDKNEYKFNISKSTLFKRFKTKNNPLAEFKVEILEDPYSYLLYGREEDYSFTLSEEDKHQKIYLPLYSPRTQEVHEKSGLNQWNASGRERHEDELYIPIPIWIHRTFNNFFPFDLERHRITGEQGSPFNLELPNGKILSAKVCQQDGKALMSNPNRELGNWLLRHVLQVPVGEKVTYEMLEVIGIDSVVVTKLSKDHFRIDFAAIGSYEQFEEENND